MDKEYEQAISKGAVSVLEPTTEPWEQRTCYIADPEGNLIEIGSFKNTGNHRKESFIFRFVQKNLCAGTKGILGCIGSRRIVKKMEGV